MQILAKFNPIFKCAQCIVFYYVDLRVETTTSTAIVSKFFFNDDNSHIILIFEVLFRNLWRRRSSRTRMEETLKKIGLNVQNKFTYVTYVTQKQTHFWDTSLTSDTPSQIDYQLD